jgi:hypothetical protein
MISSAFVPTRSMPGPVRAFADNQPVTSIVNTIRDLLARQPVHTSIWRHRALFARLPQAVARAGGEGRPGVCAGRRGERSSWLPDGSFSIE